MATLFPVEIKTPEGSAYEGEIEMISTRTTIGTIGIKANHEPIMTMLEPSRLRLYTSETEIIRFAQGEGYLQMAHNQALLLVEEAIPVDELDAAALEEQVGEAEADSRRPPRVLPSWNVPSATSIAPPRFSQSLAATRTKSRATQTAGFAARTRAASGRGGGDPDLNQSGTLRHP